MLDLGLDGLNPAFLFKYKFSIKMFSVLDIKYRISYNNITKTDASVWVC